MQPDVKVAAAVQRLEAAGLLALVADLGSVRMEGVETVIVPVPLVAPSATSRLVADALAGLPHLPVIGDYRPRRAVPAQTVVKDDRTWRIGAQSEVAWIGDNVTTGPTINSALPPVFEAYATVVVPDDDAERLLGEAALLRVLAAHSGSPSWWLGYLDTGAHDVVFDRAWKVVLYSGWSYVLVEAGPTEAGTWRQDSAWRGRLPDLIFPADHAWLVSMLWDDDWRSIGGSGELVRDVRAEPALDAYPVRIGRDATPPGQTA